MKRRDFIKISGAAAAGLGIAACAPRGTDGTGTKTTSPSAGEITGTMAQHYPGISLLGYGCMRWPMIQGPDGKEVIDQEAVNALVDEAIAHGVNYFDTSPVYLQGKSEEASSIALNRHPRSEWLLATKLSNFSDWSYDNSVKMYRRSLEVFKTDHIDYYLLHSVSGGADFDKRFGSTGIMDFLLKEREEGRIRNLGLSFHGHQEGFDELMALHDKYHWDFVQIQMNYIDWTHAGGRNTNAEYLYTELSKRDIPSVIMEPLRGGALANLPAKVAQELKAREPDKTLASWAFRYFGSFPKVMTVLSGMTYREHLEDNLRNYCGLVPLTEEELALLEKLAGDINSYPLVPCTTCQYCMPCPYGIDIPGIFKFYNNQINEGTYVSSSEQKGYAKARRRYLAAYDSAVQSVRQADHCINCRQCMPHCPQHIRIPQELRRIDMLIESIKQETL